MFKRAMIAATTAIATLVGAAQAEEAPVTNEPALSEGAVVISRDDPRLGETFTVESSSVDGAPAYLGLGVAGSLEHDYPLSILAVDEETFNAQEPYENFQLISDSDGKQCVHIGDEFMDSSAYWLGSNSNYYQRGVLILTPEEVEQVEKVGCLSMGRADLAPAPN